MPKGPFYRDGNGRRHQERLYGVPWWEQCAYVDVEAFRVAYHVEERRKNGGLSYEERQIVRARISEIQIAKELRTRQVEKAQRKSYRSRLNLNRAQALGLWKLTMELPRDVEIILDSVDNYGAIHLSAVSSSINAVETADGSFVQRFTLPRAGGYRELPLPPAAPPPPVSKPSEALE